MSFSRRAPHHSVIVGAALISAALFASRASHAQDAARPSPAVPPPPSPVPALTPARPPALTLTPQTTDPSSRSTDWYGWQTLLVDAASVGVFAIGASKESSPTMLGGGAIYALGAPAVHLAHDRPGTMGVDLALRIGLPITFAAIGYAIGDKTKPKCDGGWFCLSFSQADNFAFSGFFLGMVTAVVLDAVVLAREPAQAPPKEAARARSQKIQWSPTAGVTRGGATAGVVGSF